MRREIKKIKKMQTIFKAIYPHTWYRVERLVDSQYPTDKIIRIIKGKLESMDGFYTKVYADNEPIEKADRPKEMAELKKVRKGEWAETIAYTCPECGTELMKPDRPKGEWENVFYGQTDDSLAFRCNKCGKISAGRHNFCPNCGADMRGGDNVSKP